MTKQFILFPKENGEWEFVLKRMISDRLLFNNQDGYFTTSSLWEWELSTYFIIYFGHCNPDQLVEKMQYFRLPGAPGVKFVIDMTGLYGIRIIW